MTSDSAHALQNEEQAFTEERDRVCREFADREGELQSGQLTRPEYILITVLLVVAYALTIICQ